MGVIGRLGGLHVPFGHTLVTQGQPSSPKDNPRATREGAGATRDDLHGPPAYILRAVSGGSGTVRPGQGRLGQVRPGQDAAPNGCIQEIDAKAPTEPVHRGYGFKVGQGGLSKYPLQGPL